jgi:hypothetical protein
MPQVMKIISTAFLVLLLLVPKTFAAGVESLEYPIKTGYLYKFMTMIEWPADKLPPAGSDIVLGVFGENPFGRALSPLNGKVVKGRKITVKEVANVKELSTCQVVFVSPKEGSRLEEILPQLQAAGVLTVSEIEDFARKGGIINFYEDRNKIRFEINRQAAQNAGLNISSELLKLARLVNP